MNPSVIKNILIDILQNADSDKPQIDKIKEKAQRALKLLECKPTEIEVIKFS